MIITPPAFGQTQADFLHAIGTVESGHDDNAAASLKDAERIESMAETITKLTDDVEAKNVRIAELEVNIWLFTHISFGAN